MKVPSESVTVSGSSGDAEHSAGSSADSTSAAGGNSATTAAVTSVTTNPTVTQATAAPRTTSSTDSGPKTAVLTTVRGKLPASSYATQNFPREILTTIGNWLILIN